MRRWKLQGTLAVVVALAASGAFAVRSQPRRFTYDNCERIEDGMSRAEVEAMLGPPGDYRTGPSDLPDAYEILCRLRRGGMRHHKMSTTWRADVWGNDVCVLLVTYDCEMVTSRLPWAVEKVPQPPLDNLLWRAKRLWREWFP
jgi:hypothetical protein